MSKLNNQIINRFIVGFIKGEENACWNWFDTIDITVGYGEFRIKGIKYRAYIVAYCLANNIDNTNKLHVLHTCDNHLCVNPKHLFLGTQQDNNEDRDNKMRQAYGERIGTSKLTEEQVTEIKQRMRDTISPPTQTELAKEYGVLPNTISRILSRTRWIYH